MKEKGASLPGCPGVSTLPNRCVNYKKLEQLRSRTVPNVTIPQIVIEEAVSL